MIHFLVFILHFTHAQSEENKIGSNTCLKQDVMYNYSYFLKSCPVSKTMEACIEMCTKTDGCKGASFIAKYGKECLLFKSTGTEVKMGKTIMASSLSLECYLDSKDMEQPDSMDNKEKEMEEYEEMERQKEEMEKDKMEKEEMEKEEMKKEEMKENEEDNKEMDRDKTEMTEDKSEMTEDKSEMTEDKSEMTEDNCLKKNVVYRGILSRATKYSVTDCQNLCQENTNKGCQGFTFLDKSNRCLLFRNVDKSRRLPAKLEAMSGKMSCYKTNRKNHFVDGDETKEKEDKMDSEDTNEDGDNPTDDKTDSDEMNKPSCLMPDAGFSNGGFMFSKSATSVIECLGLCTKYIHQGCIAFTFLKNGRYQCYLFNSDKGSRSLDKTQYATSGKMSCFTEKDNMISATYNYNSNSLAKDTCALVDTGFVSGLIKGERKPNYAECLYSCVGSTGCVGFTFLRQTSTCLLYRSTAFTETLDRQLAGVSGSIACYDGEPLLVGSDSDKCLKPDMVFNFNNFFKTCPDSNTLSDCRAMCAKVHECGGYTFIDTWKDCFLFDEGASDATAMESGMTGSSALMSCYKEEKKEGKERREENEEDKPAEDDIMPREDCLLQNTGYTEGYILADHKNTVELCLDECRSNVRCAGITYLKVTYECVLFASTEVSVQLPTDLLGMSGALAQCYDNLKPENKEEDKEEEDLLAGDKCTTQNVGYTAGYMGKAWRANSVECLIFCYENKGEGCKAFTYSKTSSKCYIFKKDEKTKQMRRKFGAVSANMTCYHPDQDSGEDTNVGAHSGYNPEIGSLEDNLGDPYVEDELEGVDDEEELFQFLTQEDEEETVSRVYQIERPNESNDLYRNIELLIAQEDGK